MKLKIERCFFVGMILLAAMNIVQAADRRQDVESKKGKPAAMPVKTSKIKDEKPLRFIFITTCVGEDFFKPVKKG